MALIFVCAIREKASNSAHYFFVSIAKTVIDFFSQSPYYLIPLAFSLAITQFNSNLLLSVLPSMLVNKAFRHVLDSKQITNAHSAKLTRTPHFFFSEEGCSVALKAVFFFSIKYHRHRNQCTLLHQCASVTQLPAQGKEEAHTENTHPVPFL